MSRTNTFILLGILLLVAPKKYNANEHTRRTGKFFGAIWGVGLVRFKNDVCDAADGLSGTCYTKRQCSDIDGIASGGCASNIGVCCVVQLTCGGASSYNNTYFTNSLGSQITTSGGKCTFTIKKCNSDICQVRIDFLNFVLAQPDANGVCVSDVMNIIGGASTVPEICGENSGQHVYLDFNGDSDIKIIISTSSDLSVARSWRFKVTQIGCDCPTRAPSGCLQYYTDLTNSVKSFNYGKTGSSTVVNGSIAGSRQLANLNYGICIDMKLGYCGIQWNQASSSVYSFTVSNNTVDAAINNTIGTVSAATYGARCRTDFIIVPNPIIDGASFNTDRFCGNGLPTLITYSKPFILTVVTDADETKDVGNRGFALSYTQLRCTNRPC